MKILMSADMPYFEHAGQIFSKGIEGSGLANVSLKLAKELASFGHEVDFVCPGEKNLTYRYSKNLKITFLKSIQINYLNNLRWLGTAKSSFSYLYIKKVFKRLFNKKKYDLFHGHTPHLSIGGGLAANELGLPYVLTLHSFWPVCYMNELSFNGEYCIKCSTDNFLKCIGSRGRLNQLLKINHLVLKDNSVKMRKQVIFNANKITTVSNYVNREICERLNLSNDKIITIPNIFNLNESLAGKSINKEKSFLWAGRIIKSKGLDFLLAAFSKVLKRYPDTKLDIIGSGPYKSKLLEISKNLGISENVKFNGWMSHEKVLEKIREAVAVVLPSIWPEPLNTLIVEALGNSLPVIASNTGGSSELISHGQNGFLSPPKDSNKLYEYMVYFLENEDICEEMGRNGVEFVLNNFNSKTITNSYIKIYKEI